MQNAKQNNSLSAGTCLPLLIVLLVLASCQGTVPSLPESTFSSKHYDVTGTVPVAELETTGALMDAAFTLYGDIAGVTPPAVERFKIRLYHRRAEYEKHAEVYGFRYGTTAGFFAPDRENSIYVIDNPVTNRAVTGTLVHEGFHQFAYHALYFRVPLHLQKSAPAQQPVLMSLPLWLNEGIATVLESASFENHRLVIAPINHPRLKQLKRMVKKNDAPSVGSVLSLPAGSGLSGDEYAVFWGLTYDIFLKIGVGSAPRLSRYLSQCRSAFYRNTGNYDPGITMVEWHKRIAEKGSEALLAIILKPGESLEDWEQGWKKRMMSVPGEHPQRRPRSSLELEQHVFPSPNTHIPRSK